jgi:hypothetical protein
MYRVSQRRHTFYWGVSEKIRPYATKMEVRRIGYALTTCGFATNPFVSNHYNDSVKGIRLFEAAGCGSATGSAGQDPCGLAVSQRFATRANSTPPTSRLSYCQTIPPLIRFALESSERAPSATNHARCSGATID